MRGMYLTADLNGQLGLKHTLELLKLKPAKRRRLLGQMARIVQRRSARRIRRQRDLYGKAYSQRKGAKRGKMLKGLPKKMSKRINPNMASIGFADGVTAAIARAHQDGIDEVMNAQRARQRYGAPKDYSAPASRRQARKLREAGYKIRRENGKGWKSPSLRWITENLTSGKAGLILKKLTDDSGKDSWVIPVEARSFLGVTDVHMADLERIVMNTLVKARG